MKKAKKSKKVFPWLEWLIASIVIYCIAAHFADAWRGYKAVGGEIFLLVIPFAAYAIQPVIKDWVALIKEIK